MRAMIRWLALVLLLCGCAANRPPVGQIAPMNAGCYRLIEQDYGHWQKWEWTPFYGPVDTVLVIPCHGKVQRMECGGGEDLGQ